MGVLSRTKRIARLESELRELQWYVVSDGDHIVISDCPIYELEENFTHIVIIDVKNQTMYCRHLTSYLLWHYHRNALVDYCKARFLFTPKLEVISWEELMKYRLTNTKWLSTHEVFKDWCNTILYQGTDHERKRIPDEYD